MKEKMKENLQGMFWNNKSLDFKIPFAENKKNAIHIFIKNIVPITWNYMSTLEMNPTTLPQTETILKGQSVSGISINQLMQVKNYGEGAKRLVEIILNGQFKLNQDITSQLHKLVGKEDALTWGEFRNSDISIMGVDYIPPTYTALPKIAEKGFSFLIKEFSAKEQAIAAFLFLARSQFFHDANKRTASLVMNGILMQNGYVPITIINKDSEEFHTKLSHFYNSGDATNMMQFFEKNIEKLYPQTKKKNNLEQ